MRWLARLLGTTRSPYAKGGVVPSPPAATYDQPPALLSPCAYTLRRDGETWPQATDRLTDGEP